jgi:catalase
MASTPKDSIQTRKVAILAADGVDEGSVSAVREALIAAGAQGKLIAPHGGTLSGAGGAELEVDFTLLTASSVLFDAVYVADGAAGVQLLQSEAKALHWVNEAYNHCKTIGAAGAGIELLRASALGSGPGGDDRLKADGVITGAGVAAAGVAQQFIQALMQHRHWSREQQPLVPA